MPSQSLVDVELLRVRATLANVARELTAVHTHAVSLADVHAGSAQTDEVIARALRAVTRETTEIMRGSEESVSAVNRHVTDPGDGVETSQEGRHEA